MLQHYGQFIHVLVTASLMAHGGNVSCMLTYLVSVVRQQLFLQAVPLGNTGPQPLQLLLELGDGHLPVQLHRFQHLQLGAQLSVLQLGAPQVGLDTAGRNRGRGKTQGADTTARALLVKMLICIYPAFLALTSFPCHLVKVSFVLLILQLALQAVPLCCQLLQTVTQAVT